MKLSIENAIERVYDYCNLNIGEDDDCIYKSIYKYKVLRELEQERIDEIYDEISSRLGLMK